LQKDGGVFRQDEGVSMFRNFTATFDGPDGEIADDYDDDWSADQIVSDIIGEHLGNLPEGTETFEVEITDTESGNPLGSITLSIETTRRVEWTAFDDHGATLARHQD
jgi:hypothetical protein